MDNLSIDIVGSGNVAWHLERALADRADVAMVNPHAPAGVRPDADVIIVAVSDDAIPEVMAELPDTSAAVCHTSGSTPIDAVPARFARRGVLYPLNTFTRGVEVDYRMTPVFTEGDAILERVGRLFSDRVVHADSDQRAALHVAAVFACNYVNYLWVTASGLLERHGLDFDSLRPLIATTAAKAMANPPSSVQTGPAARGDMSTIRRHEALLAGEPELALYAHLADSMLTYLKK